jgi:glycosyltransferase involved in cell wall biosynthesis
MTMASAPVDVSVVLSTYNRAERLGAALDSLLEQHPAVSYEIIVVDNNSTDRTHEAVEGIIERAGGRVRYAFEPRQGLSHGRNTGIALSRAPIIAFTDDDIRAAPDWILQVRDAFHRHPEVDYVGGRVLPNWLAQPPAWLTTAHWAPLALQDYGEEPFSTGRHHAICLVGANLSFRREVFDQVGLFTPDLGRIKDGIGSTEDYDMQLRVWRAGMTGIYSPLPVVVADVTPDRFERSYHRRWHHGNGRHCAMMRLRELVPADMGPMSEPQDLVTLFGAPAFVYADVPRYLALWIRAAIRRADTLFYEHQLRHVLSYLRTSYRIHTAGPGRGPVGELINFLHRYFRKHTTRVAA